MSADEDRLNAYRAALINLCQQQGGTLLVKTPEVTPPGTLLWRWTAEGLEFRFHTDTVPS